MVNHTLDVEQARAYYDAESAIIFVHYRGTLTGDAANDVYGWLEELYDEIDVDNLYGIVFDFREVKDFDESNLKTARRVSSRMNMRIDTSHVPAALIIRDPYHQEILFGSMRVSPEHARKKIVWSEEEAREFLDQWHAEHP